MDATACAGVAAALALCTAKAAATAGSSNVIKGTRPLINNILRQMFPLR